jgi:hypothetical protein
LYTGRLSVTNPVLDECLDDCALIQNRRLPDWLICWGIMRKVAAEIIARDLG